ncbi:MAG: type II secretion system protein [Deltaproteobacteria bacterium]|nr:type II secretion system protein [Deltaproteobacteria bacterium]
MVRTVWNVRGGMKKKCVPAGFSLIELMIVIALIAIVTTFAVPTWQKYRANTDLKSAAREVMADISDAKQRAVTENLDVYRMTFNTGGNSYALSRTDGVTAGTWTKSLASYGTGIVINSVNFGGTVVSFNNRGTVTNGNLVLRNGLGSTATITVNITGRTYVEFAMQ